MSHPYIQAALARDRQNMLLAEAEAARLAKQVRTRHQQRGTSATCRPPLRWTRPGYRQRGAACSPAAQNLHP
jgi:hypothetical protein